MAARHRANQSVRAQGRQRTVDEVSEGPVSQQPRIRVGLLHVMATPFVRVDAYERQIPLGEGEPCSHAYALLR
jgi:hypothetical protein